MKKTTLKPGNEVFGAHTQYHKTFIVIDCCNQFLFIPFIQTTELLKNELSDADVTDEDIESDASTKTGWLLISVYLFMVE